MLSKIEAVWNEREKQVDYLGEIDVHGNELENYCRELGKYLKHWNFKYPTSLAILAVNCAYYKYDDKGFWPHFCDLLEIPNNTNSNQTIGYKIEQHLRLLGKLQKERSGSFRYVGAIIEQCGITRRYIPVFASFVGNLERRYGWDGICTITYKRYLDEVPTVGASRYLCDFLKDDAGWEFVRDVAKNIMQYQRGILDLESLKKIKGFRPSFWEELLNHLDPQPKKAGSHASALPKLLYDPDLKRLVIRLDRDNVRKGLYKLDSKIVHEAILFIGQDCPFQDAYDFEIVQRETNSIEHYSLKGWNPLNVSDHELYALFHEVKGYIDDPRRIISGMYYLVAGSEFKVPKDIIKAHLIGLKVGGRDCRVYLVDITNAGDIFPGAPVDHQEQCWDFLSWENDRYRLKGALDVCEVFSGGIPRVRLNHVGKFAANEVMLLIDTGKGIKRIQVNTDSEECLVSLFGNDITYPVKGTAWVESIGRTREFAGESKLDSLSFCVLPACSFSWPTWLLQKEDEPEIVFNGLGNISVAFEDAIEIDENSRWKVMPGKTLIEGNITCGTFDFRVALRFFRAFLDREDNKGELLEKKELQEGVKLIASGVPNQNLEIYLVGESNKGLLGSPGKFDGAGKARVTTHSVRDALLQTQTPVGRFALGGNRGPVSTPLTYLDIEKFEIAILEHEDKEGLPAWMSLLPSALSEAVREMIDIVQGKSSSISTEFIEALPGSLRGLALKLVNGAELFDEVPVAWDEEHLQGVSESFKELEKWYQKSTSLINGDWNDADVGLSDCGSDALLLLPLSRWREKTEAIRSYLRQLEDIPLLVEEWAREVVGPHRLRFNSKIAQMPMGLSLTESWQLYSKIRFDLAYQRADCITSSTPFVMQLSSIAKIMSLIHCGRTFDEQMDIGKGKLALPLASVLYANRLLIWYKTKDTSLAAELKGPRPFNEIGSASIIINLLPLSGEDKLILNGHYMDFERLTAGEYGDLLFFLGSVYAEIKGDKEKAEYLIKKIVERNGGSLPEFLQYFQI